MHKIIFKSIPFLVASTLLITATAAHANHSWGGYHWARTANPFTLNVGNNVSSAWNAYLSTTSSDWSASAVLDTAIVPGKNFNSKNCRPSAGRVEVCNATYGNNGWLGIAQVWVSGQHITQGVVKLNDTYFNTVTYNKPAWRNLVVCQEVAHTFGLDHQDTTFTNANLGTCMDYTNDPDGTILGQLSNEHSNQHDYDELGIIYSHQDSSTTLAASKSSLPASSSADNLDSPGSWGKAIRTSSDGKASLLVRDLGNGEKVFTFVTWAK